MAIPMPAAILTHIPQQSAQHRRREASRAHERAASVLAPSPRRLAETAGALPTAVAGRSSSPVEPCYARVCLPQHAARTPPTHESAACRFLDVRSSDRLGRHRPRISRGGSGAGGRGSTSPSPAPSVHHRRPGGLSRAASARTCDATERDGRWERAGHAIPCGWQLLTPPLPAQLEVRLSQPLEQLLRLG